MEIFLNCMALFVNLLIARLLFVGKVKFNTDEKGDRNILVFLFSLIALCSALDLFSSLLKLYGAS